MRTQGRNRPVASDHADSPRWSRHITDRCAQRRIEERDVRRVLERPFVSGPSEEQGVRWHVGRARCGRGCTWHWIKVIESRREGRPTLITSYPLIRNDRRRGER